MRVIHKIDARQPLMPERKRVAAYARVSRDTERLKHSFSAQVSYYNDYIQKNPEWQFAGVYADEGISGTSLEARDEFRRLLTDCDAGKIDIILTKSISRFARNTIDLLQTVRHLREHGIAVIFDEQGINTLSGDGELMLTILASFAQEESISQSRNITWSKKKAAGAGEMTNTSVPFGYRFDNESGRPVIIPEQADVVRWIFDQYVNHGKTAYQIADLLNERQIPAQRGNHWQHCTVRRMLRNVNYTGDMLLGKNYSENPLTHKRVQNRGEMPMFYVENSHEGIINHEIFEKAQAELDRCSKLGRLANPNITVNHYTGKIICKGCGRPYGRMTNRMRGGEKLPLWSCKKPGGKCMTPGILERELDALCAEQLGTDYYSPEMFEKEIDHIEIGLDDVMTFYFRDGRITTHQFIRRKKSPLKAREAKKNG